MQTKIVLSASVLVFAAQLVSAGPIKIRGSTTVSNIQDNDLLADAKGAAVDISLLKKRGCKGSTTVTNIQDNDGVDAKGLTLDLGLLKRGSTTVSNIQDNDLLADAKGAAVLASSRSAARAPWMSPTSRTTTVSTPRVHRSTSAFSRSAGASAAAAASA
ncbi:hypothetical protein CF328_g5584, partial [Tilletia controversa]